MTTYTYSTDTWYTSMNTNTSTGYTYGANYIYIPKIKAADKNGRILKVGDVIENVLSRERYTVEIIDDYASTMVSWINKSGEKQVGAILPSFLSHYRVIDKNQEEEEIL